MKKGLTELVFILDRSGSMAGLESDTIGGFNAMIEKQKKLDGECLVSTVLFDNQSQVVHDRVDIRMIQPMTEEDYYVRGCTALWDAMGSAIRHIRNIHRYIRDEDVPEHTMFVITTDGMENASHTFHAEQVKSMVKLQERKGWEFLFLGANIDAISTARSVGIRAERAVTFTNDSQGVATNYEAVSGAIRTMRSNQPLTAAWKESIEKDHQDR